MVAPRQIRPPLFTSITFGKMKIFYIPPYMQAVTLRHCNPQCNLTPYHNVQPYGDYQESTLLYIIYKITGSK